MNIYIYYNNSIQINVRQTSCEPNNSWHQKSSSNTKKHGEQKYMFFCFNATCLLKITLQVNRSTRRCGRAGGEGGDSTWAIWPYIATSIHTYVEYYLYKYIYISYDINIPGYIEMQWKKHSPNFIQIEKHLEVEVVLHEGLHRNPLNSAQSGFDHLLVDNQQSWLQGAKQKCKYKINKNMLEWKYLKHMFGKCWGFMKFNVTNVLKWKYCKR